MSNYFSYTFALHPAKIEYTDLLCSELGALGFDSFQVSDKMEVLAFLPEGIDLNDADIPLNYFGLFDVEFFKEKIPTQNWNKEWEKNYFSPIVVGDYTIRAPFHEHPTTAHQIIIAPQMSFGTGSHQTTRLMMEELINNHNLEEKSILDMGCGTGVLAILCEKKGSQSITAIDYDIWSYKNCLENVKLNDCSHILTIHGDASSIPLTTYDLILANIHLNVLIADMKRYHKALKPEGIIHMSGFFDQDLEAIRDYAESIGLVYISHKAESNWCRASFRKPA